MPEVARRRRSSSDVFISLHNLIKARELSGQFVGDGQTRTLMGMGELARQLVDAVRAEAALGQSGGGPLADQYRELLTRDRRTAEELYKLVVDVNGRRLGRENQMNEAQVREMFGLPPLSTKPQRTLRGIFRR